MSQHQQLKAILLDIEQEMRQQNLWQSLSPSPEALASQQPFCVDTLSFCEWTQWIMLPRLHSMVEMQLPLPSNSDIFSMADEALKLVPQDTSELAKLILALDNCLRTAH